MKQIDDRTLANVLNTLDQVRKRLGQHAYDKRVLEPAVVLQIAEAVASAQRTLLNLSVKETA